MRLIDAVQAGVVSSSLFPKGTKMPHQLPGRFTCVASPRGEIDIKAVARLVHAGHQYPDLGTGKLQSYYLIVLTNEVHGEFPCASLAVTGRKPFVDRAPPNVTLAAAC
jgi:hypothetical protein